MEVLARFRLILAVGFVLAVALAVLAIFKVSSGGLSWRGLETYESQATINVTQQGFPDGRVILGDANSPTGTPGTTAEQQPSGEAFADPSRFANLAIVYSYFAKSDAVRSLIHPNPEPDQIALTPVAGAQNSGQTLSVATLDTVAHDPTTAIALNKSALAALQTYLERQQEKANVRQENRVRIDVLTPANHAFLIAGHSKTPALAAFILVMAAAFALAYCLDNLYPTRPQYGAGVEEGPQHEGPMPVEDAWPTPAAVAEDVWSTPAAVPAPPRASVWASPASSGDVKRSA
jgi:hypothetical protein